MLSHHAGNAAMTMSATSTVALLLIALLWFSYLVGVWRTRGVKAWR